MPDSIASSEKSFSKLKLIATYLLFVSQERLSTLGTHSSETIINQNLSFSEMVQNLQM
jgi:hypothetical protein